MSDHLPIRYAIPKPYKKSDFGNIIDRLINKTKLRVNGNGIKMGMFDREEIIERLGKKFKVRIFALFGKVKIEIEEVKSV